MGPPKKRSKTHSAARSGQPEKVFLIDESMGAKLAREALRDAGYTTTHVTEHFAPGTADEIWLARAGQERWIVVTRDRKLRKRQNEVAAILEHRVFAVIVAAHGATGQDVAEQLRKYANRIVELASTVRPPAIFTLTRRNGPQRYDIRKRPRR